MRGGPTPAGGGSGGGGAFGGAGAGAAEAAETYLGGGGGPPGLGATSGAAGAWPGLTALTPGGGGGGGAGTAGGAAGGGDGAFARIDDGTPIGGGALAVVYKFSVGALPRRTKGPAFTALGTPEESTCIGSCPGSPCPSCDVPPLGVAAAWP